MIVVRLINSRWIAALVALLAAAMSAPADAGSLAAPTSPYAESGGSGIMRVVIDRGGEGPTSHDLLLPLNKAAIIELPRDAHDVLVSNPEVADAVIRTPRRAYVIGVAGGQTNAFFFDAQGRQILNLEIRVERDISGVQDMLERLIPDGRLKAEALNDHVVVSGVVNSPADADRAVRIAQRFVEDPEHVLSVISVTGKEQVLLKVRIVEMQRTIIKQLGVNLSSTLRFTDELTTSIATQNEFSVVGRSLGGLSTVFDYDNLGSGDIRSVDGTLQALERVGLVRTLAEPNLTAITGEPAEFLAGGEFPVPVGRDAEGQVIVEYKPFGVGLAFTPLVLSEGRISLFVSTEVSELTNQGALDINASFIDTDGDGIFDQQIPGQTLSALKVRRAQTTVELPSGGSLVVAGLLQDQTSQNIDGTPGAKDVPGLGALFRARDFASDETELVVIITPYLVDPVGAGDLLTPADGQQTAGDLETVLLGRLTRIYSAPGASVEGKTWRGPIGFALEEG